MIHFSKALPDLDLFEELLGDRTPFVLYDQNLLSYPETATWLSQFENGYSLYSGEELKNIKPWPDFLKKFLPQTIGLSAEEIVLVSVGGGSVGDFVGFLASVLKRGVSLWHVPSTWLASIDSAHGGKTAMNVGYMKNQIGSFHSADHTFISQLILSTQSAEQELSAYGELIKIALIADPDLLNEISNKNIWEVLPKVIEEKLKIVHQDPFEKKGIRQVLNLGHTLGHALELHNKLPHGQAVLLGLNFAVEWSRNSGKLSEAEAHRILPLLKKSEVKKAPINRGQLREALLHDKKVRSGDSVRFVFIHAPGKTSVELTSIDDILNEAERQGWAHG